MMCCCLERLTGCDIGNNAGIKINLDLVSCTDCIGSFFALHNRQADVDRRTIENTSERRCDDAGNAIVADNLRGMFTGRAAAKVLGCYHNVALLYVLYEFGINIFHAVGSQFYRICNVEIARRNDNVGIDVIAIFKNRTSCFHV